MDFIPVLIGVGVIGFLVWKNWDKLSEKFKKPVKEAAPVLNPTTTVPNPVNTVKPEPGTVVPKPGKPRAEDVTDEESYQAWRNSLDPMTRSFTPEHWSEPAKQAPRVDYPPLPASVRAGDYRLYSLDIDRVASVAVKVPTGVKTFRISWTGKRDGPAQFSGELSQGGITLSVTPFRPTAGNMTFNGIEAGEYLFTLKSDSAAALLVEIG